MGRVVVVGFTLLAACAREPAQPAPVGERPASPDAQHQGISTPHGDHTPHHGGMVLMNGELHYEVVFDPAGAHRIWFSNAVREDLPASIARDVRMTISRPNAAPEAIALEIDDAGESWIARGRPVERDGTMVTLTYITGGTPHQVEIPFLIPAK